MMEEQFLITDVEREKVLKNYFKQGLQGRLDVFPSKEKGSILLPKK